MLAVNRQDRHLILVTEAVDQFTCHYHRLFVGQSNGFAGADGRYRWRQSCKTDHRCQDHINLCTFHHLTQRFGAGIDGNGQVGQRFADSIVVRFVGDDHGGGIEQTCLFHQQLPAVVGRENASLKQVGVFGDDLQGLCSDATCGAEDGYLFLFLIH